MIQLTNGRNIGTKRIKGKGSSQSSGRFLFTGLLSLHVFGLFSEVSANEKRKLKSWLR